MIHNYVKFEIEIRAMTRINQNSLFALQNKIGKIENCIVTEFCQLHFIKMTYIFCIICSKVVYVFSILTCINILVYSGKF